MEKIELKVKHKAHKAPPTRMTSIEETAIQMARLQQAASTSALYERKHNQKALKVLTVAAYILFVSMAAITLSFYYVFIWDPSTKTIPPRVTNNCDNKVVIPESLAIRLANATEVTAENFFKNIFRSYQTIQKEERMVEVKQLTAIPPTKIIVTPSIEPVLQSKQQSLAADTKINKNSESTSSDIQQPDEPPQVLASSAMDLLKLNHLQDDEDSEIDDDYESSGNKVHFNNDTMILLDEEINRNNI